MKFTSIIKKNFMLLMRSKSSAFILLAGPVVIILLVGLFFGGKSTYDLSVGYYAPNPNDLTADFIKALDDSGFVVHEFVNESSCTDKIKRGLIQTCIVFPPDFQVQNARSTELRFIVDYSRINLVYKVIDAVSGIIDVESNELSESLTNVLLSRISSSIDDLKEHEKGTSLLYEHKANLTREMAALRVQLDNMDLNAEALQLSTFQNDINSSNATLDAFYLQVEALSAEAYDLYEELDMHIGTNESLDILAALDEINNTLGERKNESHADFLELLDDFDSLDDDLEELFDQLEKNNQIREQIRDRLDGVDSKLSSLKSYADLLIEDTKATRKSLESIDITRAETIVSPINTKIEPLLAESSTFQFAFPFLLILMLMFASLMIASTVVIFEKNSRALFRNFATPISRNVFIWAHFLTVLLIVMAQSLIILFFSYFVIQFTLFSNLFCVLALLISAVTFFTVFGLIIGFVFSSQEGAVMASLVLGALFLFVSNLVVPLESFAPNLANIIQYNPFIIFSELLRQALLFGTSLSVLFPKMGILFLISMVILGIVFAVFGVSWRPRPFRFSMSKGFGKK